MLGMGAEMAKATTICGSYEFIQGFDPELLYCCGDLRPSELRTEEYGLSQKRGPLTESEMFFDQENLIIPPSRGLASQLMFISFHKGARHGQFKTRSLPRTVSSG